MDKVFSILESFWHIEGKPMKIFGTVRPKIFPGKMWYPLLCIKFSTESRDMPPLIHKFLSKPENFWKIEGFLYKAFRFGPVRQKTIRQNRDAPSSCLWKFSIKEFLWNTKVFSNETFWYSQTKTFAAKSWYTPLLIYRRLFIPENF